MKDDLFITDDQRVPGIIPPLIADDVVSKLGVDIDDFPFSFVTPLGANHHDVCHYRLLVKTQYPEE